MTTAANGAKHVESLLARQTLLDTELTNPATGRERRAIPDQPGMFVALAFSPDSRILALADRRGRLVRLWDLDEGAERTALQGAEGSVLAVAISPDGRTLATGGLEGTVKLWDPLTGQLRATLQGRRKEDADGGNSPAPSHRGVISSLAFSADGRMLAAGHSDRSLTLWKAATDAEVAPPKK